MNRCLLILRPHVKSSVNCEYEESLPRRYRHVLLAVHRVTDRIGLNPRAGLKPPERFARLGVEREEMPFATGAEDQPASGRKHSGHRVRVSLEFPAYLSSLRFDGFHRAGRFVARQVTEAAPLERFAGPVLF